MCHVAFRGADNRAFNDINRGINYAFWGGAVEFDWAAMPNNRLVASLMYNWARPPEYDAVHQVDADSAPLR